ncbi:MAG: PLP-dependent aminotransferase family protein [Hylemonella sp.]|uniref:MocR-like pyridoxine biosynthesis transcription factor PdxR n=1 Tax=Hylemonella sp. TaxID=2066020 RepID=UPI0022C4E80B|nr:PLP-dependent aminotransferase family protein [Hylemonella sp.]MCZ8251194.1 PLP-dependent aminotransferase family protein [Hylemonella sp.]
MKQSDQLATLFAHAIWRLDPDAGSLRVQMYRQLRDAVTEGRVAPGTVLPSTRDLAAVLGVSRSTVVEALDQLRMEGYLVTRQGAATRIAALDPIHLNNVAKRPTATEQHWEQADGSPTLGVQHWLQDDPPTPVTIRAFRPGLPDIRAFPAQVWATHLGRRARQPASHDLSYVGHAGVSSLREQIVRHIAETRHVVARPEQVIVLPSAQTAFDVAMRCTLREGDTAWVEDPGYPGIRTLLRAHKARIEPVPVDVEGLCPAGQRSRPRLIYLTPSHQYPTGTMLSLARRLELLEVARAHGAVIIEDDFDSEFQAHGQPVASLQGLDRNGVVMYVGTFSKSLAPGLRIAYLVVPPAYVGLAETIVSGTGIGVSIHVQLAMADFMAYGELRRHIHRMNVEYSKRLRTLHRILSGAGYELILPSKLLGGLQLCIGLPEPLIDLDVVSELQSRGLVALPLSALCHGQEWRGRQGLLLGVGLVPTDEVEPAARTLCAALEQCSETVARRAARRARRTPQ